MPDLTLLDNPGWHALSSHHRHLAIRGQIAARYPPDVLVGAALPASDPAGLDDLRSIVAPGEIVGLFANALPASFIGWEQLGVEAICQMVCEQLQPAAAVEAVALTADNVPEMLALVAIARPGPFLSRTIAMGHYYGIRREGELVAMAGERLHLTGFCEISAVCTHPDHRGRGYGGALTTHVAQNILARGETPFLHHVPGNETAARLYRKLGFRQRTKLSLALLRRPPEPDQAQ